MSPLEKKLLIILLVLLGILAFFMYSRGLMSTPAPSPAPAQCGVMVIVGSDHFFINATGEKSTDVCDTIIHASNGVDGTLAAPSGLTSGSVACKLVKRSFEVEVVYMERKLSHNLAMTFCSQLDNIFSGYVHSHSHQE